MGILTFVLNIPFLEFPFGKKDHQIEDTNNEMTEYPKIHVNITPSAYIAVKDKISEVLQLKAQGPINNSPYNFQRSV